MIGAYLAEGHDVVLPQMLIDPRRGGPVRGLRGRGGAEFVERFMMDSAASSVARFARRGAGEATDPWHDQVRTIVAANGGEAELRRCHAGLERLLLERPGAVVIASEEGRIDRTYESLLASLR